MGERTLVAVERPDGRYDVFRSQWGGQRPDRLATLAARGSVPPPLDDSGPLVAGVGPGGVLDALDPREYEALVVVGDAVEAYLVCWLGVETASPYLVAGSPADRAAAVVPCPDRPTAMRLRRFLRTAKSVLGDAVDAGLLSVPVATTYLGARLARHPDVPTDTLWLPLGQWPPFGGDNPE